jgi:hypothetical protein
VGTAMTEQPKTTLYMTGKLQMRSETMSPQAGYSSSSSGSAV